MLTHIPRLSRRANVKLSGLMKRHYRRPGSALLDLYRLGPPQQRLPFGYFQWGSDTICSSLCGSGLARDGR